MRIQGFKGIAIGLGLAIGLTIMGPTEKAKAETPVGIDFDIAYNSAYMWRGWNLNADTSGGSGDTASVIQPGLTLNFSSGLSLNFWGSYSADGDIDGQMTEWDYTLSYAAPVANGEWSAGYIYYTFPALDYKAGLAQASRSNEAFLGYAWDVPLSPALTWYYDFEKDGGDGSYINLSLGHSFDVNGDPEKPTLDLGLSTGYTDGQWGSDNGIANVDVSLSYSIPAGEGGSVTPLVDYTITPGDAIIGQDNELWFGLGYSYSL